MKQIRSVHLLFIILTIAIIGCFWIGFLFGKESQKQTDLIAITEAQLEAQGNLKTGNEIASVKDDSSDLDDFSNAEELQEEENPVLSTEEDSVDANAEFSQPQFYLKESGEYISVYVSATDELYFETDILLTDLPGELQEDLIEGVDFYSLDGVYKFLENYSS